MSLAANWSAGEQTRALQLLMVWVCWVFFQVEGGGGSPGTTAILFTLAVYLVEGPRRRRHYRRTGTRRSSPRNDWWPDALSKAENGGGAASVELTAKLLHAGGLASGFDTSASKVNFRTPFAKTPVTAAAAAVAAAAASGATPKTPSRGAEETSLEGAMTRLAGAAELGTEALIYVRRSDVAQIVDFLIDNARTPVGFGMGVKPAVTSPTLARLALVRRSRRRDLPPATTPANGRRACSPVPRADRPPSAFRRLGSPSALRGARGGGGGSSRGRRSTSASPSSRMAPPPAPASGGRALFQDGSMTTPPLRAAGAHTNNGSSSERVTFRARSPADSDSPSGSGTVTGTTRRVRAGQEGKQRRLRQRVRSPSPPPAAAAAAAASSSSGALACMTPVALARNCEAPLSAAAPTGDGLASTSPGKKKLAAKEPSLLAAKMQERVAIATRATAREGKKRCTPVIQRKSGEREGTDFDDFWSSGWG